MPRQREAQALRATDDIDRIVAVLLNDPTRADDMKQLLRQKMKAPSAVRLFVPRVIPKPPVEDADELWDNVPV